LAGGGDGPEIELNQRRYLNLTGHTYPGPPPIGAFQATQQLLRTVLSCLVAAAPAVMHGSLHVRDIS
jgi:hypothetical protein